MLHDDFYFDLCAWIEKNLDKSLGMTDIANKAGYSKWYLQRLFKSSMGITLGKYISNRRITRTAIAMRYSNLKITDILMLSGFDSQQSFTRSFKNHFGITPAVYSKSPYIKFKGIQKLIAFPHNYKNDYFITNRKIPTTHAKQTIRTNIEDFLNISAGEENWRKPMNDFLSEKANVGKFTMIVNMLYEEKLSFSILQELSFLASNDPKIDQSDKTIDCLAFPFSGNPNSFLLFRIYVYYNLMPDIDVFITGMSDFFEGEISHYENNTQIDGCLFVPVHKLINN